jgi:hypothetical protein
MCRPEYEKLELQDLQSFLDGLTEEQRAELRELYVCRGSAKLTKQLHQTMNLMTMQ